MAFVWLEVIYGGSGGVAVGLNPHVTAVAILVYSVYTLAMMGLFGVEEWCERGEIFSVYFGMLSQLGSFGVKDGRIGVRKPFSAAVHWATIPGSAAVVSPRSPAPPSTAPRRAPSRAGSNGSSNGSPTSASAA